MLYLNKKDIASSLGIKDKIVEDVFEAIIKAVVGGNSVRIVGFGEFVARERKGRLVMDPHAKIKMSVPSMMCPKFKPGKRFKQEVRGVKK